MWNNAIITNTQTTNNILFNPHNYIVQYSKIQYTIIKMGGLLTTDAMSDFNRQPVNKFRIIKINNTKIIIKAVKI